MFTIVTELTKLHNMYMIIDKRHIQDALMLFTCIETLKSHESLFCRLQIGFYFVYSYLGVICAIKPSVIRKAVNMEIVLFIHLAGAHSPLHKH